MKHNNFKKSNNDTIRQFLKGWESLELREEALLGRSEETIEIGECFLARNSKVISSSEQEVISFAVRHKLGIKNNV